MVKDRRTLKGHDTRSLGPSDRSDTGSDVNPGEPRGSDSDAEGTGERENVEGAQGRTGSDSGVDRVVDANEAGLGKGLDEAEEALRKKPRRGSS